MRDEMNMAEIAKTVLGKIYGTSLGRVLMNKGPREGGFEDTRGALSLIYLTQPAPKDDGSLHATEKPEVGHQGRDPVTQSDLAVWNTLPEAQGKSDKLQAVEKPDIVSLPEQANSITDQMGFQEAFTNARIEVGPSGYFVWHGKVFNTMYDSEINSLTSEDQEKILGNIVAEYRKTENRFHEPPGGNEYGPVVMVHDIAPVATSLIDNLSLKDAFAVARAEIGPGGTFTWQGRSYSTYTVEEYSAMNEEEKHDFAASTGYTDPLDPHISEHDIHIQQLIDPDVDWLVSEYASHHGNTWDMEHVGELIRSDYIEHTDGSRMHVGLYDADGELEIKIDYNNDGIVDIRIIPTEHGDMEILGAEGEMATLSNDDLTQLVNTLHQEELPPLWDGSDIHHSSSNDFYADEDGLHHH
ncbi:MAG: hypothetical protein INR73_03175 [Williamsia sp.]|nr:hypothetical protein [Williamsia sp.]